MTTINEDLKIPTGLSKRGRKAAQTILRVMKECEMTYTGGCKLFYTPAQWKERGETYGRESLLIVVHDGGDAAHFFNWDYGAFELMERMSNALNEVGCFAEQCTSWYTAIYE